MWGDRKNIALVFRDVEHACVEVLGLDCGLSGQRREDLPNDGIVNGFEKPRDGTRRSDTNLVRVDVHTGDKGSFTCWAHAEHIADTDNK